MSKFPSAHRIVAASLLTLTGTLAAAQTARPQPVRLPISQKPLTLTYFVGMQPSAATSIKTFAEQSAYKVLAAKTNISIDFQHPTLGSERERFNLLIASGRLPDVIEVNWVSDYPGGPEKALRDGVILPLNDLIARYAPNLQRLIERNAEVRRQITTDTGVIYAFPFLRTDKSVRSFYGLQVRQDWLDKLKLPRPTSVDSWYRVLKAFKTRDPNGNGRADELPFVSRQPTAGAVVAPGLEAFTGAFGILPGFYQSQSGKVAYGPAQPGYRQFLTTMRRWYAEGLIDPDYVATNDQQLDAKILNNTAGAFAAFAGGGLGRYTNALRASLPSANLQAAAWPTGPARRAYNTHFEANRAFNGLGAAITPQNKHVIETVKFLDYGYSRDGNLALNFGQPGVSYTLVGGKPTYTDEVLKNAKLSIAEGILKHARPQSGPLDQNPLYLQQFYPLQAQKDAVKTWGRASTDLLMPPIGPDLADASRFVSIMSDVNTYAAEMTTKFINGREPLENFDRFVSTLKSQGVDQAVQIMQSALDRYNAKK